MGLQEFNVTSDTTYCTSLCFDRKKSIKFDTATVAGDGSLSALTAKVQRIEGGNNREAFIAVRRLHVIDGFNNITLNGGNTQAGFKRAPPLCHSHLIRRVASSSFHKL